MNDTIMASIAAAKAQSGQSGFSLYTGFRSSRSKIVKPFEITPAQPITNMDEITRPVAETPLEKAAADYAEGRDHMQAQQDLMAALRARMTSGE